MRRIASLVLTVAAAAKPWAIDWGDHALTSRPRKSKGELR